MPIVAVAVVPASPALLPEVSGPGAVVLDPVRAAVTAAVAEVLTGVDHVLVAADDVPGSLAGFGAPVVPDPDATGGGWAHELGEVLVRRGGWEGHLEHLDVSGDIPGEDTPPAAVVVLADGTATRGPRAPRGEDDRAPAVDAQLAADLIAGREPTLDADTAAALGVSGLTGLRFAARAATGLRWRLLAAEAPLGVGYLVAVAGP